jgi:6-phosphofructokinase 1
MEGNLLVAHGGGPTAVINASLQGVIQEGRRHPQIQGILGARFGVEGLLAEEFVDLTDLPEEVTNGLSRSPGSALGSCRRKLTEKDYPRILQILEKHRIGIFLYNGGNDSMDTCRRIADLAQGRVAVLGIPKTIDNDLAETDHCPGFGSAARWVAVSSRELANEARSLPIHVIIMEVMGRNAGWLAAASSLAALDGGPGPALIYCPERPLIMEEFLQDVAQRWSSRRGLLVVASEGLVDPQGKPLSSSGILDGFGHPIPGGVGQALADAVNQKLGIKARAEKPGLLGRASVALQSPVDREEALRAGIFAVAEAVRG